MSSVWGILLLFVTVLADPSKLLDIGINKHVDSRVRLPQQCAIAAAASRFSYNPVADDGPSKWTLAADCCVGEWQSPINIEIASCKCSQSHRIRYTTEPVGPIRGKLYNTGYAVSIDFSNSVSPALLGVPYWESSEYVLAQLHFHAGNRTGHGSEHEVDSVGYDGELHLVHYKREYGSVSEAVKRHDGLAVVGIFLQLSHVSPNAEMNRLIRVCGLAGGKGNKIPFSVDVRQLFPWQKDFYAYHGSLTTPPCSESVRWMVMKDPVFISRDKLLILQSSRMSDGSYLGQHSNVRPVVPRAGRQVEANFHC
ncbi:carbonic anhydrase 2-like [Haliotis rufescens]|uniref:carbonic anhydrase 2-like n=1 Tax=Haliotis rufescens TaxID=6454 RepID=UPI00201F539C|nr:carbonic anhydrase 2-like [Haliotis rufescens]